MRIGLLSYRSHPYSGGQGIYIRHLSSSLRVLGHQVDVLSGPPYPLLNKGINLIKIPSLDLFSSEDRFKAFNYKFLTKPTDFFEWINVMSGGFPEPYTFGVRAGQYLKGKEKFYDIIHDNQSLCYELIKLQKIFPLVSTIHHPITKDHRLELENASNWKEKLSSNRWHSFLKMQNIVAPKLNKIICPSNQSKHDVIEEFKVNGKNIEVVPNGIDLDIFRLNKEVEVIPYRIVTTASSDVPLKGLRFLIDALYAVLKDYPRTSLAVIGKAREDG